MKRLWYLLVITIHVKAMADADGSRADKRTCIYQRALADRSVDRTEIVVSLSLRSASAAILF